MLPDFRFVIGATLATTVLGVAAFGLATAVRLSHEAKVGPLESRSLAFDNRADWNQFSDPELARRFEDLARQPEVTGSMPVSGAVAAASAPQPAVPSPNFETPERNELTASIPPDMDNVTIIDDKAANFDQEPLFESTPSTATIAPAAQEPAAAATIATDPVEPLTVAVDTVAPTNVEVAVIESPPVEDRPAPERVASVPAAAPNDPAEVAQPAIQPQAALPGSQLRLPVPKPKPKRALGKRTKAKVAQASKARPRTAPKQPTAPTDYAVPKANDPFGWNFNSN